MSHPFAQAWLDAAADLGIRVVHPFTFRTYSGHTHTTTGVYLPDFGGAHGTLLSCRLDPDEVCEAEVDTPYFLSALSPRTYEPYRRARYVELLSDWGWTGWPGAEPDWYAPPDPRQWRRNPPFGGPAVAEAYVAFPEESRTLALALRQLLFAVADEDGSVGPIEETLKWGEPAYLTPHTKSGTTVRIGCKASRPGEVALYVPCQTTLVATFRALFSDQLRFEGSRAVLVDSGAPIPWEALSACILRALTYHRTKRSR